MMRAKAITCLFAPPGVVCQYCKVVDPPGPEERFVLSAAITTETETIFVYAHNTCLDSRYRVNERFGFMDRRVR
jgi:hypothetical protein